MDLSITELVEAVYLPKHAIECNFSLEEWLGISHIRYYSLARYALKSALELLNIGKGDVVALPEFICRDLIASITNVGATVKYYPVDAHLNLACELKDFPDSKVIVVVNYFGFSQDLTEFNKIANQTGAILIEDNAHGLLSVDEYNHPLGTRTNIGIFSLRKTIPLLNGAALVVNNSELAQLLPDQLPEDVNGKGIIFHIKSFLRALTPVLGITPCRTLTSVTRIIRKSHTGQKIPKPDPNAEKMIPGTPPPCNSLIKDLSCLDVTSEVNRRRKLYINLDAKVRECGGLPVFDELPDGVSPYVFPFRAEDEKINIIQKHLKALNLECHRWPDLPDVIVPVAKTHYKNVWMIPFLW